MDEKVINPLILKMGSIVEQREEILKLESAYEGCKTIWVKGKDYSIVKPFMGVAEGCLMKVAGMTTGSEDLEMLEKKSIKPRIVNIDQKFISPALGKGEEVAKRFFVKCEAESMELKDDLKLVNE